MYIESPFTWHDSDSYASFPRLEITKEARAPKVLTEVLTPLRYAHAFSMDFGLYR